MRKRYWLGIGVSVLLLYLLVRSVELGKVGHALQSANLIFLLPALAFYFGGLLLRTIRWAVLLAPVQRVPLRRLFVVLIAGLMANNLLPFRAGEGVRAFMLWNKERLEPGATMATILVERVFDGLALTSFLLLAGLYVRLDDQLTWLAWFAGAVFVVAIAGVFALTVAPGPLLGLAHLALSPVPDRPRKLGLRLLSTFEDGLGSLRSVRQTIAVAALSLGAWVLEAAMYYLLMFSFPFQPRYAAAILGAAIANLASMVPASPGYAGTFDWGLAKALEVAYQVDANLALAYTSLVHYVALWLPVTVLGVFFVWKEGLTLGTMTRRVSSR